MVAAVLALALLNAATAVRVPSVKLRDGTLLPMATLGGGYVTKGPTKVAQVESCSVTLEQWCHPVC